MGTISAVIIVFSLVHSVTAKATIRSHHPDYASVHSRPNFTKYWKKPSHVKFVTDSHVFHCPAVGYPEPAVVWLKNGRILERNVMHQPDKWSLKLNSLRLVDAGNYTCIVSNIAGHIHFTFNLVILEDVPYPPFIFEISPGNTTVTVGENVTFTCKFVSDALVFVEWIKYDEVNGTKCEKCPSKQIMNRPTNATNVLKLKNVSVGDSGWYGCVVSNTYGERNRTIKLSVLPPPATASPVFGKLPSSVLSVINLSLLVVGSSSLILLTVAYCIRRYKQRKKCILSDSLVNQVKIHTRPSTHDYAVVEDPEWEVDKKTFKHETMIGEGTYGYVVKGIAYGMPKCKPRTVVAVKMLKTSYSQKEKDALVSEMEIMKRIKKHDNIIRLLGCCTKDGLPWIIMEYADNGNLKNLLIASKLAAGNNMMNKVQKLKLKDLISFGHQIAVGMAHLESLRITHGNLTAKNILVTKQLVMKIADFGLAREVYAGVFNGDITESETVLYRWMAPEALRRGIFNTKSDVWSFGVVLWELMTRGDTPFNFVSRQALYDLLSNGDRLEMPVECPENMYEIMCQCWLIPPELRTTFSSLVKKLKTVSEAKSSN